MAELQPVTRAGDAASVDAATRVSRDQGTQSAVSVQRVDPATRVESAQSARPAARSASESQSAAENQLTEAEQRQLAELRARDREVRAHEAAHQAVAGRYAGPVQYEFQRGPDGQLYAVGGSVQIDTSPIPGDPQATIDKMETIRAAALAPGNPSAQDQAVAARAQQQIIQARAELAAERGADGFAGAPAFEGAASATAGISEASSVAASPSLTEAPPGPARDAALAFNEVEQFRRVPNFSPEARLGVDLFA